jgi:hypothetical protein
LHLQTDCAQRALSPKAKRAHVLQGGFVGAVFRERGARLDGLAGGVVPEVGEGVEGDEQLGRRGEEGE